MRTILKRYHGWAAWVHATCIPLAVALYLWAPDLWAQVSILYLVLLSQVTALSTDLDGWLTARYAKRQGPDESGTE